MTELNRYQKRQIAGRKKAEAKRKEQALAELRKILREATNA